MSTQLKLRRGTTAQHSTFTGASGEVTVDTDKKAIVVHDGATAGGFPQVSNQPTTRPSIRPSLLLDFANTKQLDPRVTFSRASTATYYDGKTVVKAEENLLVRSQEFENASWGVAGVSITANSTTAPDGTSTADTITASAGASTHNIEQSASTVSGAIYSASFYVKAGTYAYVQICVSGDGTPFANFDISTGTVGTTGGAVSAAIQNAGNGWYRCSLAYTASGATQAPIFALAPSSTATRRQPWTAVGTETVYLWGAQIEQRSTATAYTPTTTAPITNYIPALQTAAANVARFDHDPVTGESKGLLIEEQRTNLLTASQDFETPSWTQYFSAVGANAAVAPDGTLSADSLQKTTNAYGNINKNVTVANGTYTFSLYAKAGTESNIGIVIQQTAPDTTLINSRVNLSTGAVTNTTGTLSATSVGNGWYRIAGTVTSTAGTMIYSYIYSGTPGVLTSGNIFIWGAQLEAGAFATSYIPTPLTYSGRASTATYKAADGLIRIAQPNVARYEPNAAGGSNLVLEGAASNLFTYSSTLEWTQSYVDLVKNAAVSPTGNYDATKIVESNNVENVQHLVVNYLGNVTIGSTYTLSCYVKASERTKVALTSYGEAYIVFDLISGTVIQGQSQGSIIYAGNGWYRCIATFTKTNIEGYFYVIINNPSHVYVGTKGSGLYIWGAQLETGSTATSYIPSVETFTGRSSTATYYDSTGIIRTAASGVPRYTYNPSNLNAAPKLLMESAATNLLTYSEQFDNAAWFKTNASVSANATTAPDGTLTAEKLVELSDTNQFHYIGQAFSGLADNAYYTVSVYAKAGERQFIYFEWYNKATIFSTSGWVNLTTGQVTGQIGGPISATNVGNGWWRISALVNSSSGAAAPFLVFQLASSGSVRNYSGDGTSGLYIWGAQLETGYAPTSYIPTTSAQVTRAADTSTSAAGSRAADVYSSSQVTRSADSASMTGTNFSSWYRADEGTLYAEAAVPYPVIRTGFIAEINDGSGANKISFYRQSDSQPVVNVITGSSSVATFGFGATWTTTASGKLTAAYKANDFSGSSNGSTVQTDTSGAIAQYSRLEIGSGNNQAAPLCGHIKRLAYYPKRLTNAELVGITS